MPNFYAVNRIRFRCFLNSISQFQLSESTKNEMVATVNEIESGRVKIPNDIQKIIDYIEKRQAARCFLRKLTVDGTKKE